MRNAIGRAMPFLFPDLFFNIFFLAMALEKAQSQIGQVACGQMDLQHWGLQSSLSSIGQLFLRQTMFSPKQKF